MKKITIIIAAIIMMAGFTTKSIAQNTVTGTVAAAKIVKAITLTEDKNLNFGVMTVPTGDVDLVLTTSTARNPSEPTKITLLGQIPHAQNAAYTVVGTPDSHYAVTFGASTITLHNGDAVPMTVKDFTFKCASAASDGLEGVLSSATATPANTDTFKVGATLVLTSGQAFGFYTGSFDVTVNYN